MKAIISSCVFLLLVAASHVVDGTKFLDSIGIAFENAIQKTVDTMSEEEFNSKCLPGRTVHLRWDPTVYFYSTKGHTGDHLGCNIEKSIDLKVPKGSVDERVYDDDDHIIELALDEAAIKRDLIDSGLYDPNLVTYFITHGFAADWRSNPWQCDVKDMILNTTDANVFITDWSGGSKPLFPGDYSLAVSATKVIAQRLAAFIHTLLRLSGQKDASNFHLIGHSLGAQVAGYAGYSLPLLGRITGLDPAGPCYGVRGNTSEAQASKDGFIGAGRRRLSPESAQTVVALHTDTALFGLNENCAHYDIYVNGGYRQPKCGSTNLRSKINDFFQMNIQELLDPNIGCAHSYSHNMVDTFAGMFDDAKAPKTSSIPAPFEAGHSTYKNLFRPRLSNADRCYKVAYNCDSWSDYMRGECALCGDDDPRCVYTGLTFKTGSAPKIGSHTEASMQAMAKTGDTGKITNNDDYKYNDEDDEDSSTDSMNKPSDKSSLGRHFMRSGSLKPISCLYQYQVIVATSRAKNSSDKHYFFLHIPLEESGKLADSKTGARLHDRLVEVSNKLDPNSVAYKRVQEHYEKRVKPKNPSVSADTDGVDLYTALITFELAPRDECSNGAQEGESDSKKWQLCWPLKSIREAQVWSKEKEQLGAIKWAALNYMSGLDFGTRTKYSYVFERDARAEVLARDQVDKGSEAKSVEMRRNNEKNFFEDVKHEARCFMSLFNPIKSSKDFKCHRSKNFLKYALKMSPIKLNA